MARRSRALRILLWLVGLLLLVGAAGGIAVHRAFLAGLPDFRELSDYRPMLASRVLDRQRRPIGEFYDQRRRLVPIEAIPRHAVAAFVAAEDANFYEHEGLDYPSILRAAWVNLRAGGQIKQGASTITQQTVKSLLLTPERRMSRKIKEVILARRIEQQLGKQEILSLYLNQIYFGHGAYGVAEAARSYFGKEVGDLSLSEAALLAGLPQRPSDYSPRRDPEAAESRRRYVLRRMLEEGLVAEDDYRAALEAPPALAHPPEWEDYRTAAWFTEEVRRVLVERLGGERLRRDGLVIETTLDLELQRAAVAAVRGGLEALDHRQGYRGPLRKVDAERFAAALEELAAQNGLLPEGPERQQALLPRDRVLVGLVTRLDEPSQSARVEFAPGLAGTVRIATVDWGRTPNPRRYPYKLTKIRHVFAPGDVTHFRVAGGEANAGEAADASVEVTLAQDPVVEGALIALEVQTGEVLALVGGYDFERSEFNRATQARRQPGSAFKPLIYAAALERGFTPASIVVDRPVVYDDPGSRTTWRPENYGREFLGPLTLREALTRSVNNATIHLFRDVGVDYVIEFARRLGIRSPLERNLSLALGSSGVTLLELTRAYSVFANGGSHAASHFIRRVLDRDGNLLLEWVPLDGAPEAKGTERAVAAPPPPGLEPIEDRILRPEHAYLATELLRAVVEDPRGTGRKARVLGRLVAGKTGTTNEQADAWFTGFSPDVVTGVWVGYDRKRVLGKGETGARAALPIWIDFMREALRTHATRRAFPVPDGIVFARIDARTGRLSTASSERTYYQAFLEGTEPGSGAAGTHEASDSRKQLRMQTF